MKNPCGFCHIDMSACNTIIQTILNINSFDYTRFTYAIYTHHMHIIYYTFRGLYYSSDGEIFIYFIFFKKSFFFLHFTQNQQKKISWR